MIDIQNLRDISEEILSLVEEKNRQYGDSYSKKEGVRVTDLTGEQRIDSRIQEKLDRWSNFVKNNERVSEDTLVDIIGLLLIKLHFMRYE